MRFYSQYVFPRLMNAVMDRAAFRRIRKSLLSGARGQVLEIGYGSGLNLPHYPESVERLTGVDANPAMRRLAAQQAGCFAREPELLTLDTGSLPFEDGTFDTVVSTWTLCSVAGVQSALREIHRVMRPDGRFLFAEHGLSSDPRVRRWQRRLTPLQRMIAEGCHLDRDISGLIRSAGLKIMHLDNCYMEKVPRIAGYLYKGVATGSGVVSRP